MRWAVAVVVALVAVAAWAAVARADSLPEGRVFEQVTPADTQGDGVLTAGIPPIAVLVNDDEELWGGEVGALQAGQQSGAAGFYLSQRTASGWSTSSVLPSSYSPYEHFKLESATDDLSAMVFGTEPVIGPLGEPPPDAESTPSTLVYRDAGGSFTTIVSDGTFAQPLDADRYDGSAYGGMSADGQTVYYSSEISPASLPKASGEREVYEWHPAGYEGSAAPTVSRAGTAALQECGLEIGGVTDQSVFIQQGVAATNAVSSDGQSVFLQSGESASSPAGCPSASQLYVDRDGATSEISVPTDGTAEPATPSPALFQGGSPNGETAYFTSEMKLTANAPAEGSTSGPGGSPILSLYQWSAAHDGQPASVTCLSCLVPEADGLGHANEAVVSQNGQYVYFDEKLEDVTGLFVAHDGVVSEVAQPPVGEPVLEAIDAEGNAVVFTQAAELGGNSALYRSVVADDGQVGTAQCVSCNAEGIPEAGEMGLGISGFQSQTVGGARGASTLTGGYATGISADGNVIAFTSNGALGSEPDTDEVYQWTPGAGAQAIAPVAEFYGPERIVGSAAVTEDGSGIFFVSAEALTGETAQPGVVAMFDARVGGGFAAASAAPSCSGDGCQAPFAGWSAPAVGTSATSGSDDLASSRGVAAAKLLRVSASATGRRVRLRLRLRSAGALGVSGTALVDGRRTTVLGLVRSRVGRRGETRTVVLEMKLRKRARSALAKRGRLKIAVVVRFDGLVVRRLSVTLADGKGEGR